MNRKNGKRDGALRVGGSLAVRAAECHAHASSGCQRAGERLRQEGTAEWIGSQAPAPFCSTVRALCVPPMHIHVLCATRQPSSVCNVANADSSLNHIPALPLSVSLVGISFVEIMNEPRQWQCENEQSPLRVKQFMALFKCFIKRHKLSTEVSLCKTPETVDRQ